MIPARREALSQALVGLAPLQARDTAVRLRVGLADGSVVDGHLVSASRDHVALRLAHAQARFIPAEAVRSVQIAQPRRGREWALALIGIMGATAGLVGLVSLPGIGSYLRTHAQWAFGVVFYLGAGLLVLLLAKTRLRDWLTSWKPLVDVRES